MKRCNPARGLLRPVVPAIFAVVLLLAGGCHWGAKDTAEIPLPPDEREAREAAREAGAPAEEAVPSPPAPLPPAPGAVPPAAAGEAAKPAPSEEKTGEKIGEKAGERAGADRPAIVSGTPAGPGAAPPPCAAVPPPAAPEERKAETAAPEGARAEAAKPAEPRPEETRPQPVPPQAGNHARKPNAAAKPSPPPVPQNGCPSWANGGEELVFRVEFLGMTMGYARFTYKGRVSYGGRDVYHLNVRAWTSDALSIIYPINDSIDYYLDVSTLAPLRQEYTRFGKSKKDDIAFYDQEKGKIVYRYKESGEIRKQVDVPPEVHDPVSVAYYFRARDLGQEGRSRNVYAGRKVWSISTRTLGVERVETRGGTVDAVVVQPVIMRDGRKDDKGDLRMWMTNDARHVPVKIYAKFRKIRTWTLTAELIPGQKGG